MARDNYWLLKSEPDVFGIDDLATRPNQTEPWDGIRNYQARNFMRDEMRSGDLAFFYHSNCKVPGIVGIVEIASASRPDPTALDPTSNYHDPKSSENDNRWVLVDVKLKERFGDVISLATLREETALDGMTLLRRGNRLSVMPVDPVHWRHVLTLKP